MASGDNGDQSLVAAYDGEEITWSQGHAILNIGTDSDVHDDFKEFASTEAAYRVNLGYDSNEQEFEAAVEPADHGGGSPDDLDRTYHNQFADTEQNHEQFKQIMATHPREY